MEHLLRRRGERRRRGDERAGEARGADGDRDGRPQDEERQERRHGGHGGRLRGAAGTRAGRRRGHRKHRVEPELGDLEGVRHLAVGDRRHAEATRHQDARRIR